MENPEKLWWVERVGWSGVVVANKPPSGNNVHWLGWNTPNRKSPTCSCHAYGSPSQDQPVCDTHPDREYSDILCMSDDTQWYSPLMTIEETKELNC